MFRFSTCSNVTTAITLMLCCVVEVLGGDALAVSPAIVEFDGAAEPLGGLQLRHTRDAQPSSQCSAI